MDYFSSVLITLKLAFFSTFFLLIISIPLASWLARSSSKFSTIVGTTISIPLVLPPTVLGFYLLISFGPSGVIGKITNFFGMSSMAFTFTGLVIGSVIYSLPFVVGPIQSAFESYDKRVKHMSYTLGAGRWQTFKSITLPYIKSGIISGGILGFAHTVGEFGVVLMIGGNIPGETRVLSVQIYDSVEALNYEQAHLFSFGLLVFSFILLIPIYRSRKKRGGIL